jgi:hypothetical protein
MTTKGKDKGKAEAEAEAGLLLRLGDAPGGFAAAAAETCGDIWGWGSRRYYFCLTGGV